MDEMTAKEKLAVEELRRRTINDVTPKMLEDVALFYRFAKARDFNIDDAEAMLRNNISWRKELKIDTILTDYEPPEALEKYAPSTFIGFDKEGGVVRYQDCGRADSPAIWGVASKTDWVKFCCLNVERDIDAVIKRGGNLGKPLYTSIDDFENLTYANAINVKNLQYFAYLIKMFTDNYPETLKTLTLINVPSFFSWLYGALKPLFPFAVTQKVRMYGKDGWKELLLEEIDADILPACLGGRKTDPDGNPRCETFIKFGQKIPKRYYLDNKKKKLSLESDAEKLTVRPFSKEEICFEVKEENSYLEWEFQTKNGDIDFRLLFRGKTSEGCESEELIPKQRIDSDYEPERGFFKCEKVGNYTIVFDNSSSWIHWKEIYYRAGITKAKNYDVNTRYKTSSFS